MYRMATAGDIGPATLFWSDAKQMWLQLTGVMFDIEPSRLNEMISAGIEKVEMLGSGQDDCAVCCPGRKSYSRSPARRIFRQPVVNAFLGAG